jgi:hypothetical protein
MAVAYTKEEGGYYKIDSQELSYEVLGCVTVVSRARIT